MIAGSGISPGKGTGYPQQYSWASWVAQLVKNPPAMWETWVQSLGWEDPLEKGTATHSSILAWRISWGHKELDMIEQLSLSLSDCIFTQVFFSKRFLVLIVTFSSIINFECVCVVN